MLIKLFHVKSSSCTEVWLMTDLGVYYNRLNLGILNSVIIGEKFPQPVLKIQDKVGKEPRKIKLYWDNFSSLGFVIYLSPFKLLLCNNTCIKKNKNSYFLLSTKIKGRETPHPSVSPSSLTSQLDFQIKPYCTKGEN